MEGVEWLVSCVEIFQTLIPLIALLESTIEAFSTITLLKDLLGWASPS
jgi:hypothetical protein